MSGNALGSIYLELKANVADFIAGMSKASYASKQTASQIKQGFGEMGNAVQEALGKFGVFGEAFSSMGSGITSTFSGIAGGTGGAIAGIFAVGAAGVGAAAGLAALAMHGAEVVERLNLISQKTGLSIHTLQGFEAAGRTVGVSLEDMVTAMRKLDQGITGIGKGSHAAQTILKGLGVTSKDNKEALLQLADAFGKMPDGAQKAADAVAVLGRSGMQLIPLLNMGREKLRDFNDMVDQYGPKIGVEAVRANEEFLVSQAKLNLIWQNLAVTAEQTFLPAIARIAAAMADLTKTTTDYWSAMKTETWTDVGKYWSSVATGKPSDIGKSLAQPTNSGNADAAKDAADKKTQDALDKQMEAYERLKAGSAAVYALESKRAEIEVFVSAGKGKEAAAALSEIPALQKAVDLEADAARLAQNRLDIQKKIAAIVNEGNGGAAHFAKYRAPQTPEQQAASVAAAPDVGAGAGTGSFDLGSVLGKIKPPAGIDVAKAAVDDFYSSWTSGAKKTEDDVNDTYTGELNALKAYVTLGEISYKQYTDSIQAMDKAWAAALKQTRQDLGTSTFGDAFQDMFKKIADSGRDFARSLTSDIGDALSSLNSQMAKFIVTGQKMNLQKLGQGFAENLAQTGIKKVESFGADFLGTKTGKRGETAGNPLYTCPVDASGNVIGAALGGADGNLPMTLPPGALSSLTALGGGGLPGAAAGAGGGGIFGMFAGILSKLGSFAGFLAGGGDVTPGKSYIVGEDHPEFFSPKTAGTVAPSLKFSGGKPAPVINFAVNGVSDMDSFRRSQPQIAAGLQQQLAIASARNR